MFRGNNRNNAVPPFLDNRFQYPADLSNQPQLCGSLPAEFHADPVNYLGNSNCTPVPPPNRCAKNTEAIPRQNLQFSLNNKIYLDKTDRKTNILNQNHVSTGLRLSYDDDERNSSISSASGSMTATSSIFSSLRNDIRRELDQQEQELIHLIRTQEENMTKGLWDMKQRHMASIVTTLEQSVAKKLHEKDCELETVMSKNKELMENVKQVTADAQNWCYIAKYNESVVNLLKNNLQQAMQDSNGRKEGSGESYTDDAASCIDPNNYLAGRSHRLGMVKNNMVCRSCRVKEVSVLLMPCRHLCLCKECEGFVSVCPVCQMITTASMEVYLS